jgi:hypothetical protein
VTTDDTRPLERLAALQKDAAYQWDVATSRENKAYHRGRMTALDDLAASIRVERARYAALVAAARKFMDEEVGWIGDRPYWVYAGRPSQQTLLALRAVLDREEQG